VKKNMKNKKILSVVVIITFLITTVYPVIGLAGSEVDEDKSSETNRLEAVVNYLKNTYNDPYSTDISNIITSSDLAVIGYSIGSEPLSYGTTYGAPALLSYDTSSSTTLPGGHPGGFPDIKIEQISFEMPDDSFFVEFPPITFGSDPTTMTGEFWIKCNIGLYEFKISENCDWITSVYPTKGLLIGNGYKGAPNNYLDGVVSGVGQPINISIEVNVDKLSPGSHSAPLTFEFIDWSGRAAEDQLDLPETDPGYRITKVLPVVTTLWADPSEGSSPRYHVLGTESLHAWEVGPGYFDEDSKFSVILEVWDEGINPVDSFTTSLKGWELYDLDLDISTKQDTTQDPTIDIYDDSRILTLTSPMAKDEYLSMAETGSYDGKYRYINNGEHRYIKAQVPHKAGSLSLNFDGIGPYDFSVYSYEMSKDRLPDMISLCYVNNAGKVVCGQNYANPKLLWSNGYQIMSGSRPERWGGGVVDLGQIPQGQSGSSCYVFWNPVAGGLRMNPSDNLITSGISYSISPTTKEELDALHIDNVFIDWNGVTKCPVEIGNPGGSLYGGGSPFGEGVRERNSRATCDFSTRKYLPAGHYKVSMDLEYIISPAGRSPDGKTYTFIMLIVGAFYFEFDVVENTNKWPSLTQNPVHWPIYDNQTSYTMFDVTGKDKDVLFTPLSSFNFGSGGKHPRPDAAFQKEVVYDMYPKKPLDWCQLTPSNDYDSDSFIKTNVNNTPAPTTGSNSAKILGVNYRVEDKSSLPLRMTTNSILTESGIESVASKAFFVSSGGYSGEIINMIITNDPDPIADSDPIDPNETDNDSTNPNDPTDPENPDDTNDNGPPKSKTSIFLSFISRFFERLFSFIQSITSLT
jgi:hypothetical protein